MRKRIITLLMGIIMVLTGCGYHSEPIQLSQINPDENQDTSEEEDDFVLEAEGTVGDFKYTTGSGIDGESKEHGRGYSVDTLNQPDSPYFYFIYMGEFSTGGYSIEVYNIEVDENNDLYITVKERHPNPSDMVTQAFTYPYCYVSIYPDVNNVYVCNTNGDAYELLP